MTNFWVRCVSAMFPLVILHLCPMLRPPVSLQVCRLGCFILASITCMKTSSMLSLLVCVEIWHSVKSQVTFVTLVQILRGRAPITPFPFIFFLQIFGLMQLRILIIALVRPLMDISFVAVHRSPACIHSLTLVTRKLLSFSLISFSFWLFRICCFFFNRFKQQ